MSPAGPAWPLSGAGSGVPLEVEFFALEEPVAKRLRDLGLREGARFEVVHANGQLVLGVDATRIALTSELASGIFVREAP